MWQQAMPMTTWVISKLWVERFPRSTHNIFFVLMHIIFEVIPLQINKQTQADNRYTVRDVYLEHGECLKTLVEKSILDEIRKQINKK